MKEEQIVIDLSKSESGTMHTFLAKFIFNILKDSGVECEYDFSKEHHTLFCGCKLNSLKNEYESDYVRSLGDITDIMKSKNIKVTIIPE